MQSIQSLPLMIIMKWQTPPFMRLYVNPWSPIAKSLSIFSPYGAVQLTRTVVMLPFVVTVLFPGHIEPDAWASSLSTNVTKMTRIKVHTFK